MECDNNLKPYEISYKRDVKSAPLVTHVLASSEDDAIATMLSKSNVWRVVSVNGKYIEEKRGRKL